MEKRNDETNNDENSRPDRAQKKEKDKCRAEITGVCTPTSLRIQSENEDGGGQKKIPRKEKRKCCSHKLRKANLQSSSKAFQKVEHSDVKVNQDHVAVVDGNEKLPGTSHIQQTSSLDSTETGFFVKRSSSISEDSSTIELTTKFSSITQESVKMESVEQHTIVLQKPRETEVVQGPNISQRLIKAEVEQHTNVLQKSRETGVVQGPNIPQRLVKAEVEQHTKVLQKPRETEVVQGPHNSQMLNKAEVEKHPNDFQKSIDPQFVQRPNNNLHSCSENKLVGQCSSIIKDSSEIKLIDLRSSISQVSSETEFLIGELSTITQKSRESELGEEQFNISQKKTGIEVTIQRSKQRLQQSTESSFDTIFNNSSQNPDESVISPENDEQRSNSQERKRTRIESKDTQKIAEPLPTKKPRLEFESKDFDTSDAELNTEAYDIQVEVPRKTNEVHETPDDSTMPTTDKLTPKTMESVKVASTTAERKMKKPKHPKRVPILLETPITEKYTIFMKNERMKVVGGGMQGWRIRMEDAHITLLETPLDPTVAFFGVFDGHGGNEVSNYVARHLYKFILQNDRFHLGQIEIAIKEGYMNIDNHMRENDIGKFRQGTTAIILMIKDQTVYCANVGDSRAIAVIDGEVVPLSVDQKPTLPEEAKRIGLAGLPILNNRVSGGLAMSRSLGDFRYKSFHHLSALQQPVIAQPEIVKKPLTDSWEFVVIACDGIWDVMSNDLVAAFVKDKIKNGISLNEICESLFMKCLAPSSFFPNKGCDNMTAIIILFSEEMTKSTCLRSIVDKEECSQKLSVSG